MLFQKKEHLMEEDSRTKIKVAGVILHRDGKALLQHRDDIPTIYWPGAWAIFGGMVEEGETPEEAVRREMMEELSLALEGPLDLIEHQVDEQRERYFYASPLLVPLEALRLQEGQGMALLTLDELKDYPVIPLHLKILEAYFKKSLAPAGQSETSP